MNIWTIQSIIMAVFLMVGAINISFGKEIVWGVMPIIFGLSGSNLFLILHIRNLMYNKGDWSDKFGDESTWRKRS